MRNEQKYKDTSRERDGNDVEHTREGSLFLFSFFYAIVKFFFGVRFRVLLAIPFIWTNALFSTSSPLFSRVIFLATENVRKRKCSPCMKEVIHSS